MTNFANIVALARRAPDRERGVNCLAADRPPIASSKSKARLAAHMRCRVSCDCPTAAGPSPAVVLLHGCGGGWRGLDERWGKRIA